MPSIICGSALWFIGAALLFISDCGVLRMDKLKYKTKIMLIRHGESLANAKGVYLGHTDWDLSELGYQQAEVVSKYLENEKIDIIYSSDLLRAYNTAMPHARRHNLDVIKNRNLREIYLGEWEGRLVSELEESYPEEFGVGWRYNFGTCAVPSGESVPELAVRIYNEILKIARENEGKTILIAIHAAAIRAFWGKVTNTPEKDVAANIPFPRNASITTVYYHNDTLIPYEYGFADYFEE